jgi:Protein of unknown function (DUF2934)
MRSQIRERAYELFLRRGGGPGHELEDWLCAEKDHLYRPPAEMAETGGEVGFYLATFIWSTCESRWSFVARFAAQYRKTVRGLTPRATVLLRRHGPGAFVH